MVRITIELIRKRSEHNEGEIHSLEELALHQEKIEKIEFLDKWCRGLKILLMQNNLIPKIENVNRLKQLEYLNLALNNVQVIENLSGCESLKKLDLTLNFIGQLSSVLTLRQNLKLETLYLVGNPCVDYKGYREYVVAMLPNLKALDGVDISKSERIKARQIIADIEFDIAEQEEEYLAKNAADKQDSGFGFESEENEESELTNEDFWSKTTSNSIETRIALQKQIEKNENEAKPKSSLKKEKPLRKFETSDGRMLNINEPKVSFSLHDEYTRNIVVLDISLPKYLDSSLIDASIEPTYVRIYIKGKIFQLVLPEEVITDSSYAQRSKTTGHLVITMPKLHETSSTIWSGASSSAPNEVSKQTGDKVIDVGATKKRINKLELEKPSSLKKTGTNKGKVLKSPSGAPKLAKSGRKTACAACDAKKSPRCIHINDSDVPPLI